MQCKRCVLLICVSRMHCMLRLRTGTRGVQMQIEYIQIQITNKQIPLRRAARR